MIDSGKSTTKTATMNAAITTDASSERPLTRVPPCLAASLAAGDTVATHDPIDSRPERLFTIARRTGREADGG